MNPAAETLIALARQVRSCTLTILQKPDSAWLTWTPQGTSNHILWHAGHALWVQDALCIEPLTNRSELPPDWTARFGMIAHPASDPAPWPTRELLTQLLTTQLHRIFELLSATTPETLGQMSEDSGIG